jgi:ABC-2 type transport system ATP-binding protein
MDEPSASKTVVEAANLTKYFGTVCAVDHVNWDVDDGTIVGLLGPNGAGKTTLLKILLGIAHPTSGAATVLGLDAERFSVLIREAVGFVPEDKLLYDRMRVDAFLRFYGAFFSSWDARFAEDLLARWSIPSFKTIGQLSKGMRAKLMLAVVLARQPHLLLMDEPTLDLDPASVDEIFSVFVQWVSDGKRAIVLATHRLDEVERICDHVTIMDRGGIVAHGDLDDMRANWKTFKVVGDLPHDEIRQWKEIRRIDAKGKATSIVSDADPLKMTRRLAAFSPTTVEVLDMNLRNIYLAAIGYKRGRLDGVLESMV